MHHSKMKQLIPVSLESNILGFVVPGVFFLCVLSVSHLSQVLNFPTDSLYY